MLLKGCNEISEYLGECSVMLDHRMYHHGHSQQNGVDSQRCIISHVGDG